MAALTLVLVLLVLLLDSTRRRAEAAVEEVDGLLLANGWIFGMEQQLEQQRRHLEKIEQEGEEKGEEGEEASRHLRGDAQQQQQRNLATLPVFNKIVGPRVTTNSDFRSGSFGQAIAMSGNTLVVGSYFEPASPTVSNLEGAAYVYLNSGGGFSLLQRLATSAFRGVFGTSVAISSPGPTQTILVGAEGETYNGNDNGGAAYVFVLRTGMFTQLQRLFEGVWGHFGAAVATTTDANTLVVGAYAEDGEVGAVYVYSLTNGGSYSKLQRLAKSPTVVSTSSFLDIGQALVLASATTLIAGARYQDNYQGAAHVFAAASAGGLFSFQQMLVSTGTRSIFGTALAATLDLLAITAAAENKVYVFQKTGSGSSTYTMLQTLTSGTDGFGRSLAMSSNTLVVGVSHEGGISSSQPGTGATVRGAAYIYTYDSTSKTYSQQQRMVPFATTPGSSAHIVSGYFGAAVATDNNMVAVGDYYAADDSNLNPVGNTLYKRPPGEVFVFGTTPAPSARPTPTPAPSTAKPTHVFSSVRMEVYSGSGFIIATHYKQANCGGSVQYAEKVSLATCFSAWQFGVTVAPSETYFKYAVKVRGSTFTKMRIPYVDAACTVLLYAQQTKHTIVDQHFANGCDERASTQYAYSAV